MSASSIPRAADTDVVSASTASAQSAVLRSLLDKFLLAYDAHANDDSNNFGDVRVGHRLYPRPKMVANILAKVFHHTDPIDVNDEPWDEVFESEELRRTLKSVKDVEAEIRESLPLSAARKNKLRRLLELQMYNRTVMMAQHQDFGWDSLEVAGQRSERKEITPFDRMTDDIRMLAQLALSYIIPQAEFSEWIEQVAINGYGPSLHMQLLQHNFDNTDPEGCDSEAKSVEGVEGQDSVRSSIHPPASSLKRSNRKGRGKKPPKKKNGSKSRFNAATAKNKNNRANTNKANTIDAGSRIIMHRMPPVPEEVPNSRRCLLYALLAIIKDPVIKDALTSTFLATMSPKGDTPISVAMYALAFHKMGLVRVTQSFNEGCFAFNLLQIRKTCRLVVIVRLWDLQRHDWYTDHCVAWDGSIIHDHPKSVQVNNSSDRSSRPNSKAVFERIFHKKEYKRWQITNIYELIGEATIATQPGTNIHINGEHQ